jgi:hypothetical protein
MIHIRSFIAFQAFYNGWKNQTDKWLQHGVGVNDLGPIKRGIHPMHSPPWKYLKWRTFRGVNASHKRTG